MERMLGLRPIGYNPYTGTAKQYAAQIEQLRTMFQPFNPEAPAYLVQRGSGFTVASTDWDDDFDANPDSLYESDYSSKSGAVVLEGFTTNDPVRAVVAFDAPTSGSVTGRLLLSAGNAQIKMNGALTNAAASTTLTLSYQQGRNVLRVAHDGTAGRCVLDIRLFDGERFKWIDIRKGYGV